LILLNEAREDPGAADPVVWRNVTADENPSAALAALVHDAAEAPADSIGCFLRSRGDRVGLSDLTVYVVDYQQRRLAPVNPTGELSPLDVDTTVAGRAFITGQQIEVSVGTDVRLWTAVADGFVRLGVLGVTVSQVDDDARRMVLHLASIVGALLVTRGLYTDGLIMCRRTREMTLAAEMQWQLLPPLAMRSPRVSLSGVVEPAYEVGGDAFDYAINGDRLDFALFDAMGHGLQSSQLAHMAVTAYRHARRNGVDLPEILATMDEAVAAEGEGERFVTCLLGRLDLRDGHLRWMTAGHPPPMLVRAGHVVGSLRGEPILPLGLGGAPVDVIDEVLEPGDRLLAFSDGVVEAHAPGGDPFGEDRLLDLVGRESLGGLDVAETTRRLIHAVLDHHAYRLGDDATLVLVERPAPPA
jgi:hypothetical protein